MHRLLVLLAALVLTSLPPAGVRAEPPAKKLFGAKPRPAALAPRSFGSYARGCLAGGAMLPVDGPAWQAMRLSRNRNWGHPRLVRLVERLAKESQAKDGWPGLLVGDLAQPRGGPMLTGHRSHQIGLDADIWLMPMPDRRLTRREREKISAVSALKTKFEVDPKVWQPGHVTLLKRAASYPEVARIFVHPAIKKAVCRAAGDDRRWLSKIRPWWGHHYHFHVRIKCPPGSSGCVNQKPPPTGDGCGKPLQEWFAMFRRPPPKKPKKPKKPVKRRELRLAQLPAACRTVLAAPPRRVVATAALVGTASAAPGLPWRKKKAAPAPGVPLPDRKPR